MHALSTLSQFNEVKEVLELPFILADNCGHQVLMAIRETNQVIFELARRYRRFLDWHKKVRNYYPSITVVSSSLSHLGQVGDKH